MSFKDFLLVVFSIFNVDLFWNEILIPLSDRQSQTTLCIYKAFTYKSQQKRRWDAILLYWQPLNSKFYEIIVLPSIYPFLSSYERSIYSSLHFKILLCHHTLHLCRDGWRWDDIMPRSTSPYVYMALVESKTFSKYFRALSCSIFIHKNVLVLATRVQKDNVMGFSKLIWDVSEIILVLRAPEISFVFSH